MFCVDGNSSSTTNVASWMGLIKDYLKNSILPSNSNEAVNVKRRATDYVLNGDDLYRVKRGKVALRYVDQ